MHMYIMHALSSGIGDGINKNRNETYAIFFLVLH